MGFMDWFFGRQKAASTPKTGHSSAKQKQNYSRITHPDTLYDEGFDSITFIYDPFTKKLHTQPYPTTHLDLSDEIPNLHGVYDVDHNTTPIKMGYILGRFGTFPAPDPFKVIAFWNVNFKGNELADCLNAIIRQYPEYGSPDTMVMSDKKAYYDKANRSLDMANLGEIPGVKTIAQNQQQVKQDRPECAVTLDVLGEPTKLGTIMGNFHMVKDNRLPAMKAAVCAQGPHMKKELEKAGCTVQVNMLDDLIQKSNCNQSNKEYEDLKTAGRIDRKQYLRSLFADPERMEKEFRTQKDLNAAWDELQGEHRMTGFAEWIQTRSASSR